MGKYFRDNRTPIEYKNMSKNMLNALIATEDVRFEKHNGVDLKGLSSIPFALAKRAKKRREHDHPTTCKKPLRYTLIGV